MSTDLDLITITLHPADVQALAYGETNDAIAQAAQDALTEAAANGHDGYEPTVLDRLNEGVTVCACGCKYYEYDRCIDCGTHLTRINGAVLS